MSGFRFALKRPLIVLAWAGITLVASLVMAGVMFLVMAPMLGSLSNVSAAEDPAMVRAMMSRILPLYGILFPLLLVWTAVQQTAVNRFILSPEDRGFAYIKIGGDEWRQILLALLTFVVAIGWGVGWFLATLLGGVISSALGSTAGGIFGFLFQLALIGLFIFFAVRLSLASAITFQSKKVTLFKSWGATAGRFWPMLGAYLLTFLLVIAAVIVLYIILIIVVLVAFGGSLAGLSGNADPEAIGRLVTPVVIIAYLLILPVFQIIGVVLNMAALAPPADIYRQLNPTASVFD